MNDETTEPESLQLKSGDEVPAFLIPECCREGWDSCTHVVNVKQEPTRGNIGL